MADQCFSINNFYIPSKIKHWYTFDHSLSDPNWCRGHSSFPLHLSPIVSYCRWQWHKPANSDRKEHFVMSFNEVEAKQRQNNGLVALLFCLARNIYHPLELNPWFLFFLESAVLVRHQSSECLLVLWNFSIYTYESLISFIFIFCYNYNKHVFPFEWAKHVEFIYN